MLIGIFAWAMIGISDNMMAESAANRKSDVTYIFLLLGSVIYLHWALRTYLIPLSYLHETQVEVLQSAIQKKYSQSLPAGSIGIGYVFVGLHILGYLVHTDPNSPSFLHIAIFLIGLGILAQTRAAVLVFCGERQNTIEPAPPAGRGEAPRP
jgi:hypothetical protein